MQNVKKIFRVVTSATTCPRWFHDGYKTEQTTCNCTVVCVCRKSVGWQSCDNRTTIVSYFGLFVRFSCHGMRVLLSYHYRATVVRLSCHCDATLNRSSWNMQGYIRMNQTKSPADSRSNSYIGVLYCPNIRRRSIHGLTHQRRAFRWFLYCSRAWINSNRTILFSCCSPPRRLFSRVKHNRRLV